MLFITFKILAANMNQEDIMWKLNRHNKKPGLFVQKVFLWIFVCPLLVYFRKKYGRILFFPEIIILLIFTRGRDLAGPR